MFNEWAPYTARPNERIEWEYQQKKHKQALEKKHIFGLVDNSKPHCIDRPLQKVQERTRRFQESQRQAEIGRDNRKLVNRLQEISRGGLYGAGGPPPREMLTAGATGSAAASAHRMAVMSSSSGGAPALSTGHSGSAWSGATQPSADAAPLPYLGHGTLNESLRRRRQRNIASDNEGLVRRILSVKPTMNTGAMAKSYQRHTDHRDLLRKLPGPAGTWSAPLPKKQRALPSVTRSLRLSASSPALPVRGALDLLFCPGDLKPAGKLALTAPLGSLAYNGESDGFSVARRIFAALDNDDDQLLAQRDLDAHEEMRFIMDHGDFDGLVMDCVEFERVVGQYGEESLVRKFALKLGCSLAKETEAQVQRSFAQTGRLLSPPPRDMSEPSSPSTAAQAAALAGKPQSGGKDRLNLSRKCSRMPEPEHMTAGSSSWHSPVQDDTARRSWVPETTPLPSKNHSRQHSRSTSQGSPDWQAGQSPDRRSRDQNSPRRSRGSSRESAGSRSRTSSRTPTPTDSPRNDRGV